MRGYRDITEKYPTTQQEILNDNRNAHLQDDSPSMHEANPAAVSVFGLAMDDQYLLQKGIGV
ncbi:hypothetical protein [uncultured Erwinia sp.]|uniref:hypothetical protein n=1 Tax=uncultured Erwinia sp. TaxID=246798 RepID=UPI00258B6718|nr:hypothetical protein [uncultured Erwinia sp.]